MIYDRRCKEASILHLFGAELAHASRTSNELRLRSQRWRFFFLVPKVKFVMYLTFHLCHVALLCGVVFTTEAQGNGALAPSISGLEVIVISFVRFGA